MYRVLGAVWMNAALWAIDRQQGRDESVLTIRFAALYHYN